jgi:hypothetical protein
MDELIRIVCGIGVVGDIQSELPNSNASAALLRPAGKSGGWRPGAGTPP